MYPSSYDCALKCFSSCMTHNKTGPGLVHSPQNNNLQILCFVDHASLYNLVNKTNLVHNSLLVYLSISTCFVWLWAHHQEKQLCSCDTWYFLFCVDDWYEGCTLHTGQSSTRNNKYQVSHKYGCFSWWWAHSHPKHVEIDRYTKSELCTKLVLFTRQLTAFKFL